MFDIAGKPRALAGHAADKRGPQNRTSFNLLSPRGPRLAASPGAAAVVPRKHRILVVDDSLLIAERICDTLKESGYAIVGPAGCVPSACALARTAEIDGAVLDLKLGEDLCLPIASALKARGIPYLVLTGYPIRLEFPDFAPA